MRYLNLKDIKNQSVIDVDFEDDDVLLEQMGNAAEDYIEQLVNKPLDDICAENGGEMPSSLYQAMLIMTDYLYSQNRGSEQQTVDVPKVVEIFVKLYRSFL